MRTWSRNLPRRRSSMISLHKLREILRMWSCCKWMLSEKWYCTKWLNESRLNMLSSKLPWKCGCSCMLTCEIQKNRNIYEYITSLTTTGNESDHLDPKFPARMFCQRWLVYLEMLFPMRSFAKHCDISSQGAMELGVWGFSPAHDRVFLRLAWNKLRMV